MNSVSLIGTLTADPDPMTEEGQVPRCRFRIAVARHDRRGQRAPGVVYVDVFAFGDDARRCKNLSRGQSVGVAGRLEREEWRDRASGWTVAFGVLADQLDVL